MGAEIGMKRNVLCLCSEVAALYAAAQAAFAGDMSSLEQRLNELEAQNRALRHEFDAQRQVIDELKSKPPTARNRRGPGAIHIRGQRPPEILIT